MLHIERWKIILSLTLAFLGLVYAAPNLLSSSQQAFLQTTMPSWFPSKTINLGLDLRGGSHLMLEADTRTVLSQRLETMQDAARSELRKKNIGYTDLVTKRDGISLQLRNSAQDRDAAYKLLRTLDQQAIVDISGDGRVDITLDDAALAALTTQVINQSIEIIRRRVDESGTKEPLIQRQGTDRIVVQLPGVDDPERIKALLGKTAKMTFHLLDETALQPGPTSMKLPMRETPGQFAIVKKRVMVSGDMLLDSQPAFERNMPVVSFRFDSIGAKRFCDVTRENVGKPFAIVLDGEIISAPVIRDAICGGAGIISGDFSVAEANDLSLLLRAGALPAPLTVMEERTVGPTLGSDSIESGKIAALVAAVLIFGFVFLSYGLFGIFANIALILNMCFIFALLSILQATLTLPGIAGIILTLGMAVDANVLIYERIREELRRGRSLISAVDTGYKLAYGTIIDSNLTTLIVAVILFSFGTGPVKGFAVSMSLGIITSMFSAIMLTRLMVVAWLRRRPAALQL